MRNLIKLGLFGVILVLCHSSAFSVQGPPLGSYRQTCANIQMRDGTLFANCQDAAGRWRSTVLPAALECVGDVTNINGELACNRRNDWRDRDLLPRGSFRETCRNIRMRGDSLSARCQTMSGSWIRSSLDDVDHCVGEIVNDDGHLQCGRRGWQATGTFVQTCAPIYINGDVLHARCQTGDGRWVWSSLNDADGCRAGIINIDGQLRCGGGDGDDRDRGHEGDHDRGHGGLPRGSYAQTCQSIELHGDTLHARCETRDGHWISTDLNDVDRCRGDVTNQDGHLVCSR
jgi:CVNH domain